MQITDLQSKVAAFRDERDWTRFHTPKNLAQALIEEVGELNSLYLWDRQPDIGKVMEELADIQIYLLSMADILTIDLAECVLLKLKKNEQNYPVEKFRGKADKKGFEI